MGAVFAHALAITLIAGGDEVGRAMKESEIIEELEANEAQVVKEKGGLAVYRAWSEKRIELAAGLDQMVSLHASWWSGEPELRGPELRHLKGHQKLRYLNIYRMPISGECFDVLPTLPKLEELHCIPNERIKEALIHIGDCKNLRILSLEWGNIPDDCLGPLAGLTKLEELLLSGCPVSLGVRVVQQMRQLKYLALEDTLVGDDELRVIASLDHLETLFVRSPNVTDAGVAHLARCARLETLSVDSKQITCRGAEALVALPRLQSLSVCPLVPDVKLFEALSKMPRLKELTCGCAGITDDLLDELAKVPARFDMRWIDPQVEATAATTPAAGDDNAALKERMDNDTPFEELLAEASDFDLCDSTFIKIGARYGNWIDASKYTPEERVVMLTWHAVGIIDNGGFEHLFSGEFDGDRDFCMTAEAFKIAGHSQGHAIFQRALQLFPSGLVPLDAERRAGVYRAQSSAVRAMVNHKFWGESAAKNTEKHLAAYIRKNAAAFAHLK